MNFIDQNAIGGTELSPNQLHTVGHSSDGIIEFSTPKALTDDELKAIERIKQILDRLQFESED